MKKTNLTNINIHLSVKNGRVMTTSQEIAGVFKKQHKHVLEKIQTIDCSDNFMSANFSAHIEKVKMPNGGYRKNKYYSMTKDGFIFLTMGFTGKKAAGFKEAYINEFNRMANELNNKQLTLKDNQILLENNLIDPSQVVHFDNGDFHINSMNLADFYKIDHDDLIDNIRTFRTKAVEQQGINELSIAKTITPSLPNSFTYAEIYEFYFLHFVPRDNQSMNKTMMLLNYIYDQQDEFKEKVVNYVDLVNRVETKNAKLTDELHESIKNIANEIISNDKNNEVATILKSIKDDLKEQNVNTRLLDAYIAVVNANNKTNEMLSTVVLEKLDAIYNRLDGFFDTSLTFAIGGSDIKRNERVVLKELGKEIKKLVH
jgi:Rha family phage regulatory protein